MKISLIIPVYNEEAYISQCLESIQKQLLLPDEVVICDNGSTDSSTEVIKSYQKRLPIKLVHEKQKGIRFAVEKAWRSSSGDIILRTDADSILPSNWISSMVKHFQEKPHLAACGGPIFASDGHRLLKFIQLIANLANDIVFYPVKGYDLLVGANFAIRRHILEKLGGYLCNNPHLGDDQLICQKLKAANLFFRRFADCRNFTSTRRFQQKPQEYALSLLSLIDPRFYREKSS